MTQLLLSRGVEVSQRNFQQVIIRGDGKDQFNQIINKEISTPCDDNNCIMIPAFYFPDQ